MDNVLWQFMILNWQDSDALVRVENKRLCEMTKGPNRKDGFEGIQRLAQLEVKVTNYLERYGIEVKIDSMQNDGIQSWIVISRGINQYVTELPEESGKSIHNEEVAASTQKPVAKKHKEQFTPSIPSFSTTVMPIDQRKWRDIPSVEHVDKGF